jgi:tetratricopeptide (TPR) repeat protein
MASPKILRIAVVSPGDVDAERERVLVVADEINRRLGATFGVRLDVWLWQGNTYPAFHLGGPQGHVDELLKIEDADLVIGIFWKRFGTPVPGADSGTERELRCAFESWKTKQQPRIMLYFNTEPYFFETDDEIEQARKVTRYRDSLPPEAFPWRFRGADDFERQLRGHLTAFLQQRSPGRVEPAPSSVATFQPPVFHDLIVRNSHLERLREALRTKPVVAAEGLSGVGKTYLASAFAAAAVQENLYSYVWWHQPEENETLDRLMAWLEEKAHLSRASPAAQARMLMQQLAETGGLLIIDDFERVDQDSYAMLLDAARGIAPHARLLLVSKTYTQPDPKLNAAHFLVGGFDTTELKTYLQDRGVFVAGDSLQMLHEKTDGLPIAASMFATLTRQFGHDPEELLHGAMSWLERIRSWFDKLCASVSAESMGLLRALSVSDTPFNLGSVREVGRSLRLERPDSVFDALQMAYLVQPYAPHLWRLHALVASFARESMMPEEIESAHLAFARYYEAGFSKRSSPVLRDMEFNHKVLAASHYQRAGAFSQSERIIHAIAKSAKARGAYELLIQLLEAQRAYPARSGWIDYHYAHCCLIVGRVADAAIAINRVDYSANDELSLSSARLHSEVLRATGHQEEALRVISARIEGAGETQFRGAVFSQAVSLKALLLVDAGRLDEAQTISDQLLGSARRKRDQIGHAVALVLLGRIEIAKSNHGPAEERFQTAVDMFRRSGDSRGLSWASTELALVRADREHDAAVVTLREALTLRAEISDCSPEYLGRLERARSYPVFAPLFPQIDAEMFRVKRMLRLPS